MLSVLLPLIYLSFISLGLPDSLLGSAFPTMAVDFGADPGALGFAAALITLGTVISSLFSDQLIRKLGTGRVMVVSVALTAVALLMYSFAQSYLALCVLAIPLGLGGGSVDAALNGFVARNYQALHMNWLHCMWGIGATISPIIMGIHLKGSASWPGGYLTVAILQGVLTVVLLFSLPMWRRAEQLDPLSREDGQKKIPLAQTLKTPGLVTAMITFACFVGFEATAGVWATSYLKGQKGFDPATAALFSSLYFGGTTLGRVVSGLLSIRMDSKRLIKGGCTLGLLGVSLLILPLPREFALAGFVLLGLGNAPIYPAMIHLTPQRFGVQISQSAMGLQMAAAYTGSAATPVITGILVNAFHLQVVPWVVLALLLTGFVLSGRIDKKAASGH